MRFSRFFLIFIVLCIVFSFFTPLALADSNGVNVDFETATNEELQRAIEDIKAELRFRMPTKIVLDCSELRLPVGSNQTINAEIINLQEDLTASQFEWTSSDESVVTVSNGRIAAKGEGVVTITCASSLSDETRVDSVCKVTSYIPISSISVAEKEMRVFLGDSANQNITIEPDNATNKRLSIKSSDQSVVKVDAQGNTVAVGVGVSTITIDSTDGSEKSTSYLVKVPNLNINRIKIGNKITFGAFEQDNNTENGQEPISWIVLDRVGDKALLISEYVLDLREFHEAPGGSNYTNSDIRKWLNNDFCNCAFTADESAAIERTALNVSNDFGKTTIAGPTDQIFLLSEKEAEEYFAGKNRVAVGSYYKADMTEYAYERQQEQAPKMNLSSKHPFFRGPARWYMSTTEPRFAFGENTYMVKLSSHVYTYFDTAEVTVDYALGGVRPALWVDLSVGDAYIKN